MHFFFFKKLSPTLIFVNFDNLIFFKKNLIQRINLDFFSHKLKNIGQKVFMAPIEIIGGFNMEESKPKTFKDLDETMKDIAEKYFYAKKIEALKNSDYLAEEDFIEDLSFANYLSRVERAYLSLTESERNIINNEYFYQSYNQWWRAIYSKATFYRFKKMAMQRFLGAFYA